jgi:D-beta-D-heptose 7-phosphate kinase/D-beta-D-heptose 1-phosphate adenosyltransferase
VSSDDAITGNDHTGIPGSPDVARSPLSRTHHEKTHDRYQSDDWPWSGSVLSLADATKRAAEYRRDGLLVVFTNGCFDLLHRGHVQYLREARALGDVLVVGLNSDVSVTRLKGPNRPIMKIDDRAAVLTALRTVDHVVVFDDATAASLVEAIQPQVYVKGGDYRSTYPPEAKIVERYGGEFHVVSHIEGISTTKVIDSIRSS